MKFALMALALVCSSSAFAADYSSCRADFLKSADEYQAYMAAQSPACVDEMNKGEATRKTAVIIAQCKNALFTLQPMKNRSSAVCDKCKGVDAKLAAVCKDEGAQNFVNKVKSL